MTGAAMIGLFALLRAALIGTASADPAALRAPTAPGASVGGALGAPELSVGAWLEPAWLDGELGVALEARLPGSALGASVARRWNLAGGPEGWGVDASAAGGLLLTTLDPGFGLTLTPTIQAGWRGQRVRAVLDLTSPAALRLNGLEARLPLIAEDWLLVRAGRTWLGLQLGAGAVFVPGGVPAMHTQLGAVISVDLTPMDRAPVDLSADRDLQPRPTPAPRPAPR